MYICNINVYFLQFLCIYTYIYTCIYTYIYIYICNIHLYISNIYIYIYTDGGIRHAMFTILGYGYIPSQILSEAVYLSDSPNTIGKGMNPMILPRTSAFQLQYSNKS